jgi:DNA-binding NarL/FixJ family response regulator
LSQREFQVFLKLAMGRACREIARAMALSPKAVSNYRARILCKMGMQSTHDLAQYARSKGLIS